MRTTVSKIYIFTEKNITNESRQQCRDFAMHLKEDGIEAVFISDVEEALSLTERRQPIIGLEFPESTVTPPCDYVVRNPGELWYEDIEEGIFRAQDLPLFITETKRCLIREFAMSDMDELVSLYSAPHVTDYIEPLYPYEEEKAYQRKYIDLIYKLYGFGMWLIFEKETGRLIGRAGLEMRDSCKDENQAELGYVIHPDFQKKGYATEVCTAIIELAFEQFCMKSLVARCNPKNVASIATLKKLGFKSTGTYFDEEELWILNNSKVF